MLDAKDAARDLRHHKVGVVVTGDSCDRIAILDTCLDQNFLVEADALDRHAVEAMAQRAECVDPAIDDRDVVSVVRQQRRQMAAHTSATDNNDVHALS